MSNSNLAIRQRRTVPLDIADDENDDGGGDHSIHTTSAPVEDHDSLRYSASHSRPSTGSRLGRPGLESSSSISRSSHSSRSSSGDNRSSNRRIKRSDYHHQEASSSRRRRHASGGGEGADRDNTSHRRSSRPLSNGSGHSRGSVASAPSQINTDELKKRYSRKKNLSNSQRQSRSGAAAGSGAAVGTKTPSTSRRNKLTIGDHNNNFLTMPLESNSDLQDLLNGGGDDKDNNKMNNETSSSQKQRSSIANSPVTGWKTPFEVDRPRGVPTKIPPAPLSSDASIVSTEIVDPSLSEEQDAWAGIDNLLQSSSNSLDDSCVFSMCDILPKHTVQAMRKGRSSDASVITYGGDDNDGEEESVFDVGIISAKRSVSAMSKTSNGSGSSHSGSRKGNKATLSRKPNKKQSNKNDNDDDNTYGEGDDQFASKGDAPSSAGGGGGNLFDVFHWSDKTNVDSRQRTKKLNQTVKRNNVQLSTSISKPSNHSTESDDMSMPSLASFRHDELNMSRRSAGSGWLGDSRHNYGDVSSVVTEDLHLEEFGGDNDDDDDEEFGYEKQREQELDGESTGGHSKSLAGDGLVLNKQVDEYIRKIQMQLPTISEDGGTISSPGGGKNGGDALSLVPEETSPSPTSIVEDSPFEKLPSLASLSSEKVGLGGGSSSSSSSTEKSASGKQLRGGSNHSRKIFEKKGPKQSLSAQFMTSMSSIKGLGKLLPTGTKKQAVANGDEEKYFPEPVDAKQSLKSRAGQSLLSEVNDDGVNWD